MLEAMAGTPRLIASVLYGTGLRLMEAATLRVKDVDLDRGEIIVRHGKGGRDRVTMLPQSLVGPIRAQIDSVRMLHRRDRAAGRGGALWRCRMRLRASRLERPSTSGGNGYFRQRGRIATVRRTDGCGTTSTRVPCSERCPMPVTAPK